MALSEPVYWKGDPTDHPPYQIPDDLLPEQLVESGDSGWLLLYHHGHTCCDVVVTYPIVNGQVHYLTEDNNSMSFPLAELKKKLRD